MKFIDKDPMTPTMKLKNKFNQAIKNKTTASSLTGNPLLKMVPPKKPTRNAPANKIKQYGDKGYVPSTGKGVGH